MPKPIGGRGKKGVGTTHIRVPLPIADEVRRIIQEFYDEETSKPVNKLPSLEEMTTKIKKILAQKKSARASFSKLLSELYGQEIEL